MYVRINAALAGLRDRQERLEDRRLEFPLLQFIQIKTHIPQLSFVVIVLVDSFADCRRRIFRFFSDVMGLRLPPPTLGEKLKKVTCQKSARDPDLR